MTTMLNEKFIMNVTCGYDRVIKRKGTVAKKIQKYKEALKYFEEEQTTERSVNYKLYNRITSYCRYIIYVLEDDTKPFNRMYGNNFTYSYNPLDNTYLVREDRWEGRTDFLCYLEQSQVKQNSTNAILDNKDLTRYITDYL